MRRTLNLFGAHMKREKMVLGLGPGSKRMDGSQDDVVDWESHTDAEATTDFYLEAPVLGWDIPQVFARLKTGEYVLGDGHSTLCGTVVSRDLFRESLASELRDLRAQVDVLEALMLK